MCGITGLFPFNELGRFHSINLQKSIDLLRHRGPDHQSSYLSEGLNMGHTRLSILDLSPDGHQPMSDTSSRYILSFNGEIYNFQELKKKLETKYTFRSSSDTEVLLYHLIENGVDGLSQLNGFFSLAFYDSHEESLILARDRFGIKPLLYFKDDDKVLFSSELASLRAFGIPEKIDAEGLYLFLSLNYIPPPYSIYEGVKKLMPGQFISVKKGHFEIKNWYNPIIRENQENNLTQNASMVREKLMQAVEKRLVSDVPLGGFLSGGIDSSIIAWAAKQFDPNFKTFSVGYRDQKFLDESKDAGELAEYLGTSHSTIWLKSDFFHDSIERALSSMNEPFADSSLIAVDAVSQETKNHVTVALSGDGADELFGGYYKYNAFLRSFSPGPIEGLTKIAGPLFSIVPSSRDGKLGSLSRRIKRYSRVSGLDLDKRYWEWSSPVGGTWAKEILKNEYLSQNPISEAGIKIGLFPHLKPDNINRVLENDLQMVLAGDMLEKVDRASMMNSLEVRVPFLDHELVEFVKAVPSEQKLSRTQNKLLLREAFKSDLPKKLFARPKKGFEIPLAKWLREDLASEVKNKWLNTKDSPLEEFIGMKRVENLKTQLFSKKGENTPERLWALICLHEFLKKKA